MMPMRLVLILCALLVALAKHAVAATDNGDSADARFVALYEREWAWRLEQFPLLATATGERRHNHRLGDVSERAQRQRLRYWRGIARELAELDRSALSPAQRINHAILSAQLDSEIGNIEVRAYLMPLNSDSAFYTDLARLPRAHPFQSADDYRNYIARLRAVPEWFDQHIALMQAGLKSGHSVPQVVLRGREAPIRAHAELSRAEDSVYYGPFVQMPETIDADTRAQLQAQGVAAIREAVTPAYARLLTFMTERYIPGARTTLAAEALPQGKDYYRRQIIDFVTLDLDPQQIHQRGLEEVARIRAEMDTVIAQAGFDGTFAEFLQFLRTDPQFYVDTPEQLLMHAAWIAKRVDAQLPSYFNTLPRLPFGIAAVPDAIAPYYTTGRYVGAAEGSREPGYYWVNTHGLNGRPLYALPALTLHEAAPGHHLQVALANEQGAQPPFRRYSYISAYGEGWALYAEHLGVEMGIYRTPYEHFGRLSYEMWRACRLVIDTGVHHLGWSREQALAYLRERTALSEHEVTTEIDRYISWPGQALSYKWGELLIRDLRARAQQELGENFDLRAFHDRILALGSVTLPLLQEDIEAYLVEAGAAVN